MGFLFTLMLLGLGLMFLFIGTLWYFGRGARFMNGYNNLDAAKRARYDEPAFLRFNGIAALILAGVLGLCAFLSHVGLTWSFWFGLVALLSIAVVNVYSMRSKRFIKKDAPEEVDKNDPRYIRTRKLKLIASILTFVVIVAPIIWLMFEGSRPINARVTNDELRIRGFYGLTVQLDDILEIALDERSMNQIGTGGGRRGHGSPNNLRGRFNAGQLIVQAPDYGPTIRIERRGDTTLFISKNDATDTRNLYNDLTNAR